MADWGLIPEQKKAGTNHKMHGWCLPFLFVTKLP